MKPKEFEMIFKFIPQSATTIPQSITTGVTYKLSKKGELIRCKDCKHRDPEDKKCECGHDIIWQLPRDDNWYCADAERKEE